MTKSKGIHINRRKRGANETYFFEQIQIETDDCLLWEYGLSSTGYGRLHLTGGVHGEFAVHNLALQIRQERPPGMFALHSCGVRKCFNYRHIYWGTKKQNAQDKIKHGTNLIGSRNPASKLTDEIAAQIYKDTRSQYVIADDFGICQRTVSVIKNKTGWKHIHQSGILAVEKGLEG